MARRPRPRPLEGGILQSVTLLRERVEDPEAYPFNIPALRSLERLELHPKVTFLVGENGSGKSTLLEAIAVATGFNAWAGVFLKDGDWHAVGGRKNEQPKLLASGERIVCFASADDYLNLFESEDTAHKTRSWLHQPATEKQLQYLPPSCRHDYNLTRYKASALMTMQFNRQAIHSAINNGRAA